MYLDIGLEIVPFVSQLKTQLHCRDVNSYQEKTVWQSLS